MNKRFTLQWIAIAASLASFLVEVKGGHQEVVATLPAIGKK